MERSIGLLPTRAAARFGCKTALIVGERRWSFRELDDCASRIAGALAARGLGLGDTVSLYAPNGFEWVASYYGILKTGAAVNPLNLMLMPEEAAFAIRDCGAAAVMGSSDRIAGLVKAIGADVLAHRIYWGDGPCAGATAFAAFIADGTPDWIVPEIDPLATSTIGYTSGTTGHPKGAELTHRGILLNTMMTATMHCRTERDTVVSALPCSHVYGNIVMNAAIAQGMTLVLHAVFDVDRIFASIAAHQATIFEGVPAMYLYMLASPGLAAADLSSLTRCTVGGQTMPVSKMEQVVAALGCPLIELWGMTELGGLGATHAALGTPRLGSIGIPLPHLQARIVDDTDAPVAIGAVGELQMRGPMVMRGYANQPGASAAAITTDGWLRTGDLAHADADGFLYVVDRLKDMIITGGFNIYPAELERALAEHAEVAMAAVGGAPDALKGEIAKAYIVRRPGSTIDAIVLERHCRERLAAYKVPRAFLFVEDLPRTSSGKVMRRELYKLG